eukprot:RCo054956
MQTDSGREGLTQGRRLERTRKTSRALTETTGRFEQLAVEMANEAQAHKGQGPGHPNRNRQDADVQPSFVVVEPHGVFRVNPPVRRHQLPRRRVQRRNGGASRADAVVLHRKGRIHRVRDGVEVVQESPHSGDGVHWDHEPAEHAPDISGRRAHEVCRAAVRQKHHQKHPKEREEGGHQVVNQPPRKEQPPVCPKPDHPVEDEHEDKARHDEVGLLNHREGQAVPVRRVHVGGTLPVVHCSLRGEHGHHLIQVQDSQKEEGHKLHRHAGEEPALGAHVDVVVHTAQQGGHHGDEHDPSEVVLRGAPVAQSELHHQLPNLREVRGGELRLFLLLLPPLPWGPHVRVQGRGTGSATGLHPHRARGGPRRAKTLLRRAPHGLQEGLVLLAQLALCVRRGEVHGVLAPRWGGENV